MRFRLTDTKKGESSVMKRKIIPLNIKKKGKLTIDEAEARLSEDIELVEKVSNILCPRWGSAEKESNLELQKRAEYYKELQTEILFDSVKSPLGEKVLGSAKQYLKLKQNPYFDENNDHHVRTLFDFAMFYHCRGIHNAMTVYCNRHHGDLSKGELYIADISKKATYRVLQIVKFTDNNGIIVGDLLSDEKFLLIDDQITRLAHAGQLVCVTTYDHGDFITVNNIWFKVVRNTFDSALSLIEKTRKKIMATGSQFNDMPKMYKQEFVATLFKKYLIGEYGSTDQK